MFRVRPLLVDVSLGADVVGQAPAHPVVAAEEDAWHAHVSAAGRVESRARKVDLVPARNSAEGDVRVAGDQRLAGRRLARPRHPVVAALSLLRVANDLADDTVGGPAGLIRTRMENRLVSGFRRQEGLIQRPFAQPALRNLRQRDHRQPYGKVVPELAPHGHRVERRPRLRLVVQHGELDGQPPFRLGHCRVYAARESFQPVDGLSGERLDLGLGDAVDPNGAGDYVELQPVGPQYLR